MSTNAIVFEWPRHWKVWGKLDITAFFRAVEALLPANSSLYIEGTSIEPDVRSLLARYSVVDHPQVEGGTIWPTPTSFHIPIVAAALSALADLSLHHAEPEVTDHILAYHNTEPLLRWYDAPTDPIFLSPSIGERAVRTFAAALSAAYCSESATADSRALRERIRQITARALGKIFGDKDRA